MAVKPAPPKAVVKKPVAKKPVVKKTPAPKPTPAPEVTAAPVMVEEITEVFSTPEGEVEVTQTILTFEEEGNGESMTDENKEDASA